MRWFDADCTRPSAAVMSAVSSRRGRLDHPSFGGWRRARDTSSVFRDRAFFDIELFPTASAGQTRARMLQIQRLLFAVLSATLATVVATPALAAAGTDQGARA